MWLLPAFSVVCRIAGRVFYKLAISGERVPPSGPLLLVANHPNSLIDPVLVSASARRPVRFLAKAPLFSDARVGWLIRGAGSIPVHRREDDRSEMGRNVDMFRSVREALADGAAVGLFPEGLTHGAPSLAPLRTGAARIAMDAFPSVGRPFPIVPIGLVFRQKDVFRSEAAVIIGPEVEWVDLAPHGLEDREAVRQLTERIDAALHKVTVNLEQWADLPLADCAVRIWEVERGEVGEESDRITRLETTTKLLALVRADDSGQWEPLVNDVRHHCRRLRRLGLQPADLRADVSVARGLRWSVRRLWMILLPAAAIALLGFLIFWPAYRATDLVVRLSRPDDERRSTHKLLTGIAVYAFWVLAIAVALAVFAGPLAGGLLFVLLPLVGMVGLVVRERWRGAWRDARRFFLLRSRRTLVRSLRERQEELSTRLARLYEALSERAPAT